MARPRKPMQITIPDSIHSLAPVRTSRGKQVYKDNPFVTPENFCIQVRKDLSIVGGGIEIKDDKQNEMQIQTGVIGKIQYVDQEQFIKLYTKNMALLFNINKTAQNALLAIFAVIQHESQEKAYFFLTYARAREIFEMTLQFEKIPSKQSFSAGMQALIKMGFLAAHYFGDGWYWFNPNLVFNGDRVKFVNEYRLKRKKEQLNQGNLLDYIPKNEKYNISQEEIEENERIYQEEIAKAEQLKKIEDEVIAEIMQEEKLDREYEKELEEEKERIRKEEFLEEQKMVGWTEEWENYKI